MLVWVGGKTTAGFPTTKFCLVLVEAQLIGNITHVMGFPPMLECSDTILSEYFPPTAEGMGGLDIDLLFTIARLEF